MPVIKEARVQKKTFPMGLEYKPQVGRKNVIVTPEKNSLAVPEQDLTQDLGDSAESASAHQ